MFPWRGGTDLDSILSDFLKFLDPFQFVLRSMEIFLGSLSDLHQNFSRKEEVFEISKISFSKFSCKNNGII